MKLRFLVMFPAVLAAAIFLLGNSGGRAAFSGAGNTGAPGDQTLPNGSPLTCGTNCHVGTQATVTITVLDSANQTVTQYIPGHQYKARLTVNTVNNALGYGFQMIALRNSNNADINGFTDTGTNNYKIATANNRKYAEHDNISTPNTFDVAWTAPAAGTGPLTFYAAGNGVNKNGTMSGDQAGKANPVVLTEMTTGLSDVFPASLLQLNVSPNPVQRDMRVFANVPESGSYRCEVFDLNGRRMFEESLQWQAGSREFQIPCADWPAGLYLLRLRGAQISASVKVAKL